MVQSSVTLLLMVVVHSDCSGLLGSRYTMACYIDILQNASPTGCMAQV